jgi:hypothetical protein
MAHLTRKYMTAHFHDLVQALQEKWRYYTVLWVITLFFEITFTTCINDIKIHYYGGYLIHLYQQLVQDFIFV